MGTVYRAHDALLNRAVAVKVMHDFDLGSIGKAQLLAEAQAAAKLNHPNIVTIYDVGEAGNTPFIIMELMAADYSPRLKAGGSDCEASSLFTATESL